MIPLSEIPSQAQRLERSGELQQAQRLYRQALLEQPDNAELWVLLGHNFHALGQADEAVASFGQALHLRRDLADAWLDLGKTLRELGRLDEATACCAQAAQLRPDDPDPLNELGILFLQRGDLAGAVACFERALRLRPDAVEAGNNLGLALMGQGRLEEASRCFHKALSEQPDLAGVHNNLGLARLNQCRPREAREQFEEAIRLQPDLADAYNNLGLALDAQGMPDEALASFERAASVAPNHVGALANLGNAFKNQGRAEAAIASYRQALALRPDDAALHSNLILAMMYASSVSPREILAEARRYARIHADSVPTARRHPPVHPRAGRRLRIGYVSADFQEHVVSFFLEPILAAHDRVQFEVFCYADVRQPDAVTERLKGYAECWRWILGLSDAEAAELIGKDEIDVLVDLHGHTAGNRLLMFARSPARVQVSYLGCLGTTGLAAMDFYLTDVHADPLDQAELYYQEQLVRLPECGFCYRPGLAPEVNPELAFRRQRRVTFGCLNNPAKLNEEVLALWSRVLAAAPGSRLLIAAGGSRRVERRLRASLARLGVSPEGLCFVGRAPTRHDYLMHYRHIDIALDPFPYNGVTTTCDALWMGVPVISLAGVAGAARQGVRFLRGAGLDELVASTPHEYVQIASVLSADLPRLEALHASLREQISRSPLMDAKRLTRDLEAAYLAMWQRQLVG